MSTIRSQRKPPTPFGKRTEHFASYGKTGTGKSVDIERCGGFFYERKYKIIDLNNADGRLEGAFFALPQQDPYLIDVLQDLPYECPPRGYPTEVFFPQYGFDVNRHYPEIFKIFSIPLHDITPIEFSILTSGEVSTAQENLLLGALEELKGDKTANLRSLAKKVEEVAERGKSYIEGMELGGFNKKSIPPVHRLIRYLYETKLVTSGECSTALDVEEIVSNKKITVFCWDFLPSRGQKGRMLADFCMHYILRKIYDLKKTYATKRKMLVILRESAVLFNKSSSNLQNWLKDFVKLARGMEVSLYFDSQTPAKIPYEIQGQIEEIFIHRMSSSQDVEVLKRSHSAKLTPGLLRDVQSLDAGQVIWLSPHKETAIKTTMPAPKSHHRREGESFEVLWKELNMPMRKLTELKDIYAEFQRIQQVRPDEEPRKKTRKKKKEEKPRPSNQKVEKKETPEEEQSSKEEHGITPPPKPRTVKILPNQHKLDAELKTIEAIIQKSSGNNQPPEERMKKYVTILYIIAKSMETLTTKKIAKIIDHKNRDAYNLLTQLENRELVKKSTNANEEVVWYLNCELDID